MPREQDESAGYGVYPAEARKVPRLIRAAFCIAKLQKCENRSIHRVFDCVGSPANLCFDAT